METHKTLWLLQRNCYRLRKD